MSDTNVKRWMIQLLQSLSVQIDDPAELEKLSARVLAIPDRQGNEIDIGDRKQLFVFWLESLSLDADGKTEIRRRLELANFELIESVRRIILHASWILSGRMRDATTHRKQTHSTTVSEVLNGLVLELEQMCGLLILFQVFQAKQEEIGVTIDRLDRRLRQLIDQDVASDAMWREFQERIQNLSPEVRQDFLNELASNAYTTPEEFMLLIDLIEEKHRKPIPVAPAPRPANWRDVN